MPRGYRGSASAAKYGIAPAAISTVRAALVSKAARAAARRLNPMASARGLSAAASTEESVELLTGMESS
eukprot:1374702-Lingulodinium_polyedra.AAC.1